MYDSATYFSWFVLAMLTFAAICLIVAIGSLPKKIAAERNHPQVDAINAASWIGLLFGGVGWVVAFIWAFVKPGPYVLQRDDQAREQQSKVVEELCGKVAQLESEVRNLQKAQG